MDILLSGCIEFFSSTSLVCTKAVVWNANTFNFIEPVIHFITNCWRIKWITWRERWEQRSWEKTFVRETSSVFRKNYRFHLFNFFPILKRSFRTLWKVCMELSVKSLEQRKIDCEIMHQNNKNIITHTLWIAVEFN